MRGDLMGEGYVLAPEYHNPDPLEALELELKSRT